MSLRKSSNKKHEIAQNCAFLPSLPLPFPRTVIAFYYVKKFLLFIQRVRALPYFLQIAHFNVFHVCVIYFGGNHSGTDKSLLATFLLYRDVMKGDPSPRYMTKEISGRRRRRSCEKDNELVADFINILKLFYILFYFVYFTWTARF